MAITPHAWLDWGNRFRTQIKEKGSSLAKVADKMGMAESTLRSCTNDNRRVNLADFFRMCEAAEIDPAIVLFGRPIMTEVQRKALGELTASFMDSDPTASPNYERFGDNVRKSVRARKIEETEGKPK